MRKDKKYVKRVNDLEDAINSQRDKGSEASLFPLGKIPERFCKKYGRGIPSFEDVIAYVSRDDAQLDLFEPEQGYSCMSIYHGLCE